MPLRRSRFTVLVILAAMAVTVTFYSRRPSAAVRQVESTPSLPPPPSPTPAQPQDLRPPQPAEVAAALGRVFGGVIPPASARADLAVIGDFNGDESPDLAVPARPPADKLPALNDELANWFREDPDRPLLGPGPQSSPAPVVLSKDDQLLIVIHGYESAGWRSPEARQAYVLKVSRSGAMEVEKREALIERAKQRKQPLPLIRGALIYEPGGARFLYWTGAHYAWRAALGR
jgi:hypothetical protein